MPTSWNPRNIVAICSSLVTIAVPEVRIIKGADLIDVDQNVAGFAGPRELRLAYFSVREYLASEYPQKSDAALSLTAIADAYIGKASLGPTSRGSTSTKAYPQRRPYDVSTILYATRHWTGHARSAAGDSDSLHGLTKTLLESKHAVFANWLWLYDPETPDNSPDVTWGHPHSPLYYTTLSVSVLERASSASHSLLWNCCDVHAQEGNYVNALQLRPLK
jgi:hypothetical protein